MQPICSITTARLLLKQGGIIAYPTEAVYGLGCCPFNQEAVYRLIALKRRAVDKGLIVLIHDWSQLWSLTAHVSDERLLEVRKTWPGPVTWVFPKADRIPSWVSGHTNYIAIRMSAHPTAHALCADGPLISTSANLTGQMPAKNLAALERQFSQGIDAVVEGTLGESLAPSAIYDVLTGRQYR